MLAIIPLKQLTVCVRVCRLVEYTVQVSDKVNVCREGSAVDYLSADRPWNIHGWEGSQPRMKAINLWAWLSCLKVRS